MQSSASTVTEYLTEVPEARRDTLERLRGLCLEVLDGYSETMCHGMACYTHPNANEPEVAFASQKQYISVYVLKQNVLEQYRPLLGQASLGKGCIRYRNPAKINFDVIRNILTASRHSDSTIC